ncbi:MAG: hypothetical protein GY928_08190 [Colwellia sp.]|nr:hypothetical protein [Colwellia sp.]
MTELKMVKTKNYEALLREIAPVETNLRKLYELGKQRLKGLSIMCEHSEKTKAKEVFDIWHSEY